MPIAPPTFRPQGQPSRHEQRQAHDVSRGSAASRGYTARWYRAARAYRADHPLCLGCEAIGHVRVADLVDHVIPHKGDELLFWDETNWQPACSLHHDVIKQRLELMFSRGQCSKADLRLDSAKAIALTIELNV